MQFTIINIKIMNKEFKGIYIAKQPKVGGQMPTGSHMPPPPSPSTNKTK